MPRSLDPSFTSGALGQQTSLIAIWAVIIEHPALDAPIRLTQNGTDSDIDGELFTACPFEVEPPEERDAGSPTAKITVANTDQFLTPAIRTLEGIITVTLMITRATDASADPPEFTAEIQIYPMRVRGIQYDASKAEISIGFGDTLNQQFPPLAFTPSDFPGLFQ